MPRTITVIIFTVTFFIANFFLFFSVSHAEVYVWTDEHGNKVYGDEPSKSDKAEQVDLEPLTILGFPKYDQQPQTSQATVNETNNPYTNFSISNPGNDQTVKDNTGNLQVTLQTEPALLKGHTIQLFLDKSNFQSPQPSTSILMKNIDRGSHSLSAKLLDENGAELKQSQTVTFHLHRFIIKKSAP